MNIKAFNQRSIAWIVLLLASFSCTREPGLGGSSTVIGQLRVISYDDQFALPRDTFFAMDQDVYLRAATDQGYTDKVRTAYDGKFEIPSLHKGDYELFVYSEDSTHTNLSDDDLPLVIPFSVEQRNQLVDLGTLTVIDNNASKGKAAIRGRVRVMNYNSDYTVLLEEYYAAQEEVFLQAEGRWTYEDRVRTNYDGAFEFDGLHVGIYYVYIYSEDSTGQSPSGLLPAIDTVTIASKTEIAELPDLVRVD